MKLRFDGLPDQDEITLRGVTFKKGKAETIDDEDLAAKCAALPYFTEVKPGRPKAEK